MTRTRARRYWWTFLGLPLVVLVAAFVLVSLAACTVVNGMLYYPNHGSRRAPEGLKKLRMEDGTEIAWLHLPNLAARQTLWFFHGNAEDLGDLEPFLRALQGAGFAVMAFDYPGYGLSTGTPNEKTVYAAARAVRRVLREELKVPAESTIVVGRSLGGGPAVQMATEERVGGLVLMSTFTSVYRVVTNRRVLPLDQFENERKLGQVRCPVLVMHGTADEVIPFGHGEALLAAANEPKRALFVPGARHNDFLDVAGAQYWAALKEFSALCERVSGTGETRARR